MHLHYPTAGEGEEGRRRRKKPISGIYNKVDIQLEFLLEMKCEQKQK